MNFEINRGGGIFSIYHMCLEKILCMVKDGLEINNITRYKICVPNHVFKNMFFFNDIFVYDDNIHYEKIPVHYLDYSFYKANENTERLELFKKIVHKNEIQPSILDKVNDYTQKFHISENTLGVHIRLTDMNHIHGSSYGFYNVETYLLKIDEMIEKHKNIDHLFIASDNDVSIHKIIDYYSDKIRISYIAESIRNPEEHCTTSDFMIEKMNELHSTYHIDVFKELLVLSKSSYFIHRISDFANFTIIYSDTFKDILSV